MSTFITPNTKEGSLEFKEWLAEHHGHDVSAFPDMSYGYGIKDDEGNIRFAVVVQTFHYPGDVLAQYFADDPKLFFSKGIIRKIIDLPFHEPFNARRLTVVINAEHERSIEVAKRWGFVEEGRMKYHFENNEAVILGMVRPDLEA